MDVQTVWMAARALGVATGLLVLGSAPQPQSGAGPAVVRTSGPAAAHWRYLPQSMSMDQALAALSR